LGRVEVPEQGKQVDWKLPDNIGTFEIRAYAVSKKDFTFGVGLANQISRRFISLQSSGGGLGVSCLGHSR